MSAPATPETTDSTTEITETSEINEIAETPETTAFSGLPTELVDALAAQGIVTPTPVQEAVIPDAQAGHDVLGRAQTGSGKTLAFGIPALAKLAGAKSRPCHPRAVMIVPTRELANQVSHALLPLAQALGLKLTTVYGGTPYDKQTRQLRQRADLVVATPGRLEDLLENGYCFFDDIQLTVLDEADHLCDLGFYPSVDKLVGMTPEGSQRMLLSATLDGDVDRLVRTHLRDPRLHELDPNAGSVTTMTHHTLTVGGFREKIDTAVRLVEDNDRTIVFTRTREGAVELAEALTRQGVEAVDLHGNLSQKVRERNLHRFSSGRAKAVVATDVAARGIHVDGVDLVIQFDPASDAKAYLHRSGRTARAGREGAVVTLTTPKLLQQVIRLQRTAGVEVLHHDIQTVPDHLSAEVLAKHGSPAPKAKPVSKSYAGKRTGGHRSGGYKGSNPKAGYRSGGGYQGRKPGQKSGPTGGKRYGDKRAAAAR
jgi:superfamily II DNA/RNA helicase